MYPNTLNNMPANVSGQKGAALVISLILLLVMTLVGVSSMGVAITEIKMANTMQQEEMALRRAERTLLVAEADLAAKATTAGPYEFTTLGDAYYVYSNDPNDPDTINPRQADWSGNAHMPGPVYSADGLDNDDAYVIEYMGEREVSLEIVPGNPEPDAEGGFVYLYRSTIRSASGKNAVRLLESNYATIEPL